MPWSWLSSSGDKGCSTKTPDYIEIEGAFCRPCSSLPSVRSCKLGMAAISCGIVPVSLFRSDTPIVEKQGVRFRSLLEVSECNGIHGTHANSDIRYSVNFELLTVLARRTYWFLQHRSHPVSLVCNFTGNQYIVFWIRTKIDFLRRAKQSNSSGKSSR